MSRRSEISIVDDTGMEAGETPRSGARATGERALLGASEELHLLNVHHEFPLRPLRVPEARPQERLSPFGRARRVVESRLSKFVCERLLSGYLKESAEYNANLVRHLNEMAHVIDDTNTVKDERLQMSFYALERKLRELQGKDTAGLQQSLDNLAAELSRQNDRITTLESVVRGLERILLAAAKRPQEADKEAQGSFDTTPAERSPVEELSYEYLLLENRFRGSEEEIERRLERYAPIFKDASSVVLELGSGRGELQRVFRRSGIRSYGIELDLAMVERCKQQELDVRHSEALGHLRSIPDGALGGLIAVQVVEHLSPDELGQLFRLTARKVKPGGKLVFETINTESLLALSHNYFRDPTHKQPLHPDTLRMLLDGSGLRVLETIKLSPYPPGALLQEVRPPEYLTPRWRMLLEGVNANINRLNGILFGHQDYAIVAEVPDQAS